MMQKEIFLLPIIDIENLGLDAGAHLLIKYGLREIQPGGQLNVIGNCPGWEAQLSAWCRSQGHGISLSQQDGGPVATVTRGVADVGRWHGAAHTGCSDLGMTGAVMDKALSSWGLAARGAMVEAGSPDIYFGLDRKDEVWAETASALYTQAAAAQWNPDVAIDWNEPFNLPDAVEDAVAQLMTYLIENEVAALVVPARFLGQLHPHFREIQSLLAIQVADEARHIEVFTRRLKLKGREPALSTAGGQASLKTLLDEPDFSIAGFLLSVLGEGTFVSLLNFLHAHAPDPVTRQIAHLAARDEARHVAFGMSHLLWRLQQEPQFRTRLANSVQSRNDALASTAGLNEEVFDTLILIAAGKFTPQAIAAGYVRVQRLIVDMAEGRRIRLERLGFEKEEAIHLAALHTRNFM